MKTTLKKTRGQRKLLHTSHLKVEAKKLGTITDCGIWEFKHWFSTE